MSATATCENFPTRFVSSHRFLLDQNLDEVIPVEPDKGKALMEQEDEECEEYEDEDFVTVGSEFAVSVSETGDRSTRSSRGRLTQSQ